MLEVLLVLLTAAGFQVCERVPYGKGAFIAVAAVFWTSYIVARRRRDPAIFREWGFRRQNLGPAAAACAGVTLIGVAAMWTVARLHGPIHLPRSFWLLLAVYPVWGLLQQFMLNALFAGNLRARLSAPVTVVIAAFLFGVTHLPDRYLTALTFVAGLVWVPIYLRWRNLWPLGVCHALLGTIAYYVLLGRDALAGVMHS